MLVLQLITEAYGHRHDLRETNAVTFDGDATDNIALLRGKYLKSEPVVSNVTFCGL